MSKRTTRSTSAAPATRPAPPAFSTPKKQNSTSILSKTKSTESNFASATLSSRQLSKKPSVNFLSPVNEKLVKSAVERVTRTETEHEDDSPEMSFIQVVKPIQEPIKAYLRIRPSTTEANATNYVQIVNETEVSMIAPADHRSMASSSSHHSTIRSQASFLHSSEIQPASVGTLFSFTKVFPPDQSSSQSNLFDTTTLPLVKDFLGGQNCLLFAYGSTGSGKTWTIQGGERTGEEGLLPRTIELVCRSLRGKAADTLKAGLATPRKRALSFDPATLIPQLPFDGIEVDLDYNYSLWISYAEIYNENIYDLLDGPNATRSPSSAYTQGSIGGSFGGSVLGKARAMFKGLTVKRNILNLKQDSKGGNKYVAGLREVQVFNAQEAMDLVTSGQSNRSTFATLSNGASSRSHSVFTLKINKIHKSFDQSDMKLATTCRFSIVDLAGSERVVNTGTSGERLKEAGNINKSLMVLGQCMETLRKNQEDSIKGKRPSIVPFRHSKLTELFQSFFTGDGTAAMIVNVNPFGTSFDESSHVMKFSALTKQVLLAKNAPSVPIISIREVETRMARLSLVPGGEVEDVIYEEEEVEEFEEEEGEDDAFVTSILEENNLLLDEIHQLKCALWDAGMKNDQEMRKMRTDFIQNHATEVLQLRQQHALELKQQSEAKESLWNSKLDILGAGQKKRDEAIEDIVADLRAQLAERESVDENEESRESGLVTESEDEEEGEVEQGEDVEEQDVSIADSIDPLNDEDDTEEEQSKYYDTSTEFSPPPKTGRYSDTRRSIIPPSPSPAPITPFITTTIASPTFEIVIEVEKKVLEKPQLEDKENKKISKLSSGGGEDSDDEQYSISKAASPKKKRMIGGTKIIAVEDIDAFTEQVAPEMMMRSNSSLSLNNRGLKKSASSRSLKR